MERYGSRAVKLSISIKFGLVGKDRFMQRLASRAVIPVCLLMTATFGSPAQAEVRLGGGVHYWTALDDIEVDDVNIDESGSSFIASLQWLPGGLLYFEGDLE
jgi:hypothetical protein